jgi:hypothetical protein
MRLTRPAIAVAAACVLTLSLTAHAAKPPLSWADQPGDANGTDWVFLDSGLPAPLDKGRPGPGSDAGRDIVKVEMANTWVKQGKKTVCTGFTATVTFSAPPTVASTIYRVHGKSETNPLFILLEHDTTDGSTDIRYGTKTQTDDHTIATQKPVKVVGNKLIWTITTKDITNIDEKVGSVMTDLYGEISGSVKGLLLLPVYDIAPAPAGSDAFTFCK